MKMNGVIIMRISDFKRFFDFQEFWSHKEEFINLFNQEGYLDFFCNTEEEKILCKCILDWLKDKNSFENVNNLRRIINNREREISRIKDILKAHNLSNSTIRGLISLFLLLSDTLKVDEIEKWLEILCGNSIENDNYPLYANKEFESSYDIKFPLIAKRIVNKTSQVLYVTIIGENPKELSSGDCIVGLFDKENKDKCYKLLPNIVKEGKMKFKLNIDKDSKSTKLIICGEPHCDFEFPQNMKVYKNQDGDIDYRYIDNVLSFFTTQYGLAVVKINGEVCIPTKWSLLRKKIDSLNLKYPDEKILCIESQTSLITEKRIN